MGGLFNITDPLFGWQLYIWGWIGFIFLSIICWVVWRYAKWEPFKPLWGLYYAYKGESHAAFIFNRGLICELLSEKDAKCIFDYSKWEYEDESWINKLPIIGRIKKIFFNYAKVFLPELDFAHSVLYKFGGRNMDVEIAKKLQNYEWESASSVNAGGIHVDMILDADNWSVKKSPQHKAIIKHCETLNEANQTDQIHSYSKYQRLLIENKISPADGITPFVTIPWIRIDSTFPIKVGDNTTLGATRQAAIEMENEDATQLSRYYLPILVGSFGFAALILLVRIVPFIFHG